MNGIGLPPTLHQPPIQDWGSKILSLYFFVSFLEWQTIVDIFLLEPIVTWYCYLQSTRSLLSFIKRSFQHAILVSVSCLEIFDKYKKKQLQISFVQQLLCLCLKKNDYSGPFTFCLSHGNSGISLFLEHITEEWMTL